MVGLEELKQLVADEITQMREEGYDVTRVEEEFKGAGRGSRSELEELLKELGRCRLRPSFPYKEPVDLNGIRTERPEGPRVIDLDLSRRELLDRILGGWLGRCAGCLLGKPAELLTKEQIEEWLRRADAYPLRNYFPPLPEPADFPDWLRHRLLNRRVLLGHIRGMPRDDDIDYTILNLHLLETVGFNFTTVDVGTVWLTMIPYLMVYTAERAAYRNLVNGLTPPETATFMNPYREWIGAQIRADMWGYVTPGKPELGAELAYRDGSLSHVKNGVYGEMFVSAMLSAAFTTSDIEEIVEIGLSEIPKRSRLAEAVRDTVNWSKKRDDWRSTWERIMDKYGHYSPVHTINNAALVLLGLLYGEGEYEKSVTISVMGGLDTDCNGATTGSILGVILGAKNLPKKWIKPLKDTVESSITNFNNSRISHLARRTLKLAEATLNS
nr:ADP-ribosylglycohydrolase family protein [Candidatus Freyrarchaeum guaymaensis]